MRAALAGVIVQRVQMLGDPVAKRVRRGGGVHAAASAGPTGNQAPFEPINLALVSGLKTEPALDILAGWLAGRIDGPVQRAVGALKVEHPGTQNQRFDYDEFAEQFKQQFGYAL